MLCRGVQARVGVFAANTNVDAAAAAADAALSGSPLSGLDLTVPVVVYLPTNTGVYLLSLWNMISGVAYIKVEQWNIPFLVQSVQKKQSLVSTCRAVESSVVDAFPGPRNNVPATDSIRCTP